MYKSIRRTVLIILLIFLYEQPLSAQVIGTLDSAALTIVDNGITQAVVVVSPQAGTWEKRAADDLVHYIELMTGAKAALANTDESINTALGSKWPQLIVGQVAHKVDPSLRKAIDAVIKPNPVLRADAIALRRTENRVLIAGNNDEAHYFAVAELLRQWGCRWYMPTEFGEYVPAHRSLSIGQLEYAYGSPFEVRGYWISWVGDTTGAAEFQKRNMMNSVSVPNGHILAKYTGDLAPTGGSHWNVPITEDKTADHVAKQVLPIYQAGKDVQLGMEDGLYSSDSPRDKTLIGLQYDKYFMTQSVSDAFMVFYNKVAERLMKAAPDSDAKIGFLAYANMTIPPVRDIKAKPPLVAYLAPIDIDPIHHMDDPRSGPRREFKDMLYRWSEVMNGRVVIYDYDQGMLAWRDIPNPSIYSIRHDIKQYEKAGILGIKTESRNAIGTTFLNLYIRGRLYWNPDIDIDAELAEFYKNFYGPAAEPMADYWNALFEAWEETISTEHEYFLFQAVYSKDLISLLGEKLKQAEAIIAPLKNTEGLTRNQKQVIDRVRFTRLSYDIISAYDQMVTAAAAEADYISAVKAGEIGLATREELTSMNGIFTTYKNYPERGYAWWPGEVKQYRELIPFIDGNMGKLVTKLPLVWNFRRDPNGQGVAEHWEKQAVDLSWWNTQTHPTSVENRQNNSGEWEQVRTDLYLQAQGLVTKDYQSYTGHGWYNTKVELKPKQIEGNIHIRFPGIFNETWLYVNGHEVGHRQLKAMWWRNDYRFEWDVDLTNHLQAGDNTLVVRINNPHHYGGMFRRPFLYRAITPNP
jgi:hypothetical protein